MRPPTQREAIGLAVLAMVLIALGAFQFGAKTKHSADKAEKAQTKADTATGKAREAQAQGNRIIKCLLNSKGPKRAARCLNLTLPKPQPGATGQAGQPGKKGLPGARGPAGPRGGRGIPGATPEPLAPLPGPKGSTGDKGAACAPIDLECRGPKGETGGQGEKGTAGDTGAAGAKGETGPAGAQGDPGPAGPQGPQGAIGPQGSPGPTGPAPAAFTFSFVDANGVQVTLTCVDPDQDLTYTCA